MLIFCEPVDLPPQINAPSPDLFSQLYLLVWKLTVQEGAEGVPRGKDLCQAVEHCEHYFILVDGAVLVNLVNCL